VRSSGFTCLARFEGKGARYGSGEHQRDLSGAVHALRRPVWTVWYLDGTVLVMAMNLRLSENEAAALRRKAEQEDRSMQAVARAAINEYTSDRAHTARGGDRPNPD